VSAGPVRPRAQGHSKAGRMPASHRAWYTHAARRRAREHTNVARARAHTHTGVTRNYNSSLSLGPQPLVARNGHQISVGSLSNSSLIVRPVPHC
jgi:hypothetical protein